MTECNATEDQCCSGFSYGIDIGGSKIELVVFDDALQAVHRQRIETPQHDYDAFIDTVKALVAGADAALGEM